MNARCASRPILGRLAHEFTMILGVVTFFGTAVPSAQATAILFNQGSWLEAPNSASFDTPGSFTMEAWVNFTDYGTCCWNAVIAKQFSHPTESGSYELMFSNHQGDPIAHDTIYVDFKGPHVPGGDIGSQDGQVVSSISLMDGNWHHIAAVFDITASQTFLYFDGDLVGSGVRTVPIGNTTFPVTIGNQSDGSWQFVGLIDEVRLWNIARTQAEIEADMLRELTGLENGLAAYWDFNEGQGTTAFDLSGNGNNAAFVGNPQWVEDGFPLRSANLPEPTTLALLGLGLAGLGFARRHKGKQL